MAKNQTTGSLGSWAFLIGVILAVVLGLFASSAGISSQWLMVLVIIGLVIGLLNVTGHEVTPFLMAGVVLIIASSFGGGVLGIIPKASEILRALLAIFVPATIIVAIKHAFSLARN